MDKTDSYSIFKNGSTTYFYSSLFFPKDIKNDVFSLYAFVRKADDFVDSVPQQPKAFQKYRQEYNMALRGKPSLDPTINNFVTLIKKCALEKKWVVSFLDSMEADLTKKTYKTLQETETYMYGSAEVIGLFMAKIMQLPPESYPSAQMLGKAMQFINFIRDVQEDNALGRTYLPASHLQKYGLKSLQYDTVCQKEKEFIAFVREELTYYYQWQKSAENGFHFIPKRYLIPIKTASDMYKWTAKEIEKNPFIIYQKKVKPHKINIIKQIAQNYIQL